MSRTRALTRDQVKTANDALKLVEVPVAEWGGVLYVRSLSAGASMDFSEQLEKLKDKKLSLATQLSHFVVDENGNRIWDVDQAMVELVNDGVAGPVHRLLNRALKTNGFGSQEVVQGNSQPNPGA